MRLTKVAIFTKEKLRTPYALIASIFPLAEIASVRRFL